MSRQLSIRGCFYGPYPRSVILNQRRRASPGCVHGRQPGFFDVLGLMRTAGGTTGSPCGCMCTVMYGASLCTHTGAMTMGRQGVMDGG